VGGGSGGGGNWTPRSKYLGTMAMPKTTSKQQIMPTLHLKTPISGENYKTPDISKGRRNGLVIRGQTSKSLKFEVQFR
jgi:hypothetical protein